MVPSMSRAGEPLRQCQLRKLHEDAEAGRNLAKRHNRTQNLEVCHMAAMRRKLIGVERKSFQGWACNECAWVFRPSGTLTGKSSMK